MSNKRTTTQDLQKIELYVSQGKTSQEIGEKLGCSKKAIDKWRQRLKKGEGPSFMGRPKRGAMNSFPDVLRQQVKVWRSDYEKRGGKTLHTDLSLDPRFQGSTIPSVSSLQRYLLEQGLTRPYGRRTDLTEFERKKAEREHQTWQLDGRGNEQVGGVGAVSMLDVIDVFSGVYTGVYPAMMKTIKSHPNTRHYQTAIRLAAMHHGLPEQVQTDHASVFFDNTSKSPFPTLFFLWLVALGVEPVFSRVHVPQDQGMVERSHQTIWNQVCRKSGYQNWEYFFLACLDRRRWLNSCLPCSSSENRPPLHAYPKAEHSGKVYQCANERELLNLDKVFEWLQGQHWQRLISKDQTISLGGQVYYLFHAKPNVWAAVRVRAADRCFLVQVENTLCVKVPIKGLDLDTLIGTEHFPLPGVQMQLPFDDRNCLSIVSQTEYTTTF
jgi:transposase InsO family protein